MSETQNLIYEGTANFFKDLIEKAERGWQNGQFKLEVSDELVKRVGVVENILRLLSEGEKSLDPDLPFLSSYARTLTEVVTIDKVGRTVDVFLDKVLEFLQKAEDHLLTSKFNKQQP